MKHQLEKTILSLTDKYTREELESIKDTLELVALSYDIKKVAYALEHLDTFLGKEAEKDYKKQVKYFLAVTDSVDPFLNLKPKQ